MLNCLLSSSLIGGFYLLLLLLFSFFVVCGIKIIILYFKPTKKTVIVPVHKPPEIKPVHKVPRTVKTITIDPEEISRIYVRKS